MTNKKVGIKDMNLRELNDQYILVSLEKAKELLKDGIILYQNDYCQKEDEHKLLKLD